jgi:glycosyltransferase involved in cell wall biosynthesis
MRVAIIHYWLVGMRGGEKVIEGLCRLYPQADIFTHVYAPEAISETIKAHKVQTSFIAKLPRAVKNYQSYLPLMPMALEQLDLRGYDLILSSESGPSKGIIPPAGALHICYCHSPMRYIWNMFHEYRDTTRGLRRLLMPPLSHYLRTWDVVSAARVHEFVANSNNVARRLHTYYRRDSTVVYPPIDVGGFASVAPSEIGDYYLMVGELVAYKRPELAVEAFNLSGKRLVVIGGGQMLKTLRAMAKPNVTILGPQPFDALRRHYARCRALVFPGEEDFGIVPVEAMASGRPVIAFNKGGALETVVEGLSGTFMQEQTVDSILDACDRVERMSFNPSEIVAHSRMFGADRFAREMKTLIDNSLAAHGSTPGRFEAVNPRPSAMRNTERAPLRTV